MRTAFVETLTELASQDPNVMLVVGDVGFGVVDEFARRFPAQFLNVGVAEANLAGVSAGLALSGARPFVYSIANFPSLRCLEQIRNDICYNGARVIIVSVGAGLSYGALGATHHATEDVAVMRALPGMTVLSPADPLETRQLVMQAYASGPAYIRIGRGGEPTVHGAGDVIQLGRATRLAEGRDVTMICAGAIASLALRVRSELDLFGLSVGVVSMHTIKPLDLDAVRDAATRRLIVTLEEHSIVGGLGSAVAEALADQQLLTTRLLRFGLPDEFTHRIGSREYLLAEAGLSAGRVATRIREHLCSGA